MNATPNDPNSPDDATSEHRLHHALLLAATKFAPLGLAALFSFIGSTAVDFFADLNRRVERLDHQCPITERRVSELEELTIELRTDFAAYPRRYEVDKAFETLATLGEYSSQDKIVVARLVNDMNKLEAEVKRLHSRN